VKLDNTEGKSSSYAYIHIYIPTVHTTNPTQQWNAHLQSLINEERTNVVLHDRDEDLINMWQHPRKVASHKTVFENFQIPVSGYNSFSALCENGECEDGDGRDTRSEKMQQHGLEAMLKYPRAPVRRKTPEPKVTVVTNFTQNNRR
jgi:hypothetical protein